MVWDKFQKKIKQYVHKRKYGIDLDQRLEDPLLALGQIMRELQASISDHTKGLEVTKQRQAEIRQYIQQFQQEQHRLLQILDRARNNQNVSTHEIQQQIVLCQNQISQYEQLNLSMENSIKEVEQAIARLQFKLNETRAKEAVLILKRNTAQTEKELGRQLSRVDLDEQEAEINRMEAEAEALLQLTHTNDPQQELQVLDQELKKQIQLQEIENQLIKQKKETEKKQAQLLDKYFDVFNLKTKKEEPKLPDKQLLITDFFKPKDKNPDNIKNFFSEEKKSESSKDEILNSFFDPKDDSKKKKHPKDLLDDFFKD
ncbi:MAG: PspA/IM30 family protein [Bacteroidia bacterium]|nr:PspA/IM30 family protein [Bacteroidia bacterium]